jgi:transglutaminase-like putative cysteine protease
MSRIRFRSGRSLAISCLLALALTVGGSARAVNYDSIAVRYKNENAVVADYTHKLVITLEDGKLVANSYVTKEKMMISDVAPGIYNTDYFYHGSFHELTDLDANAFIPTAKGYRKVACNSYADINPDKDMVFYDDSRYAVISYSGLVKNAYTQTKYSLEHSDLHMLPDFLFQENIPVAKATFEVTAPKYVNINFILKGVDTSFVKRSVEEKGNNMVYTFTAADVPAYKDFSNVPSPWYYLTHVIPIVASYKLPNSNKTENVLGNTDDFYKYMYKYVRNLNMKDDTTLDKIVATVTKGDATPQQKAAHIYQWVQHNMHYIAFEQGLEGFVPREASVVLQRKYGDCKDMSNILVAMLRKAKLDAYHTWIGTRERPYTYEETPSPIADNHMICAININGDWIFADGTHPVIPFGKIPDAIQDKEALIAIDEKNYKVVTLPEAPASDNITYDSTVMTFDESKVTGTVLQSYKGYKAWDLGVMMMYRKNDEREKAIKALTERGSNKYVQTSYNVMATENGDKDISVNSSFTIDNYVQQVKKETYINMNLKHTFEDMYINTEDRKVPYYNDYKEHIREVVVMDIPKDYRVTHIPAPSRGGADGLWSYSISYKVDAKNRRVILTKEYTLNTMQIRPGQFATNNKLVDDLKKQYKETVTLSAK